MITAIAAALGVREAIHWLIRWAAGSAGREKSRFRILSGERDAAEKERDAEAAYRRIVQEHASYLRSLLIEHGVPPDKIPPWPTRGP